MFVYSTTQVMSTNNESVNRVSTVKWMPFVDHTPRISSFPIYHYKNAVKGVLLQSKRNALQAMRMRADPATCCFVMVIMAVQVGVRMDIIAALF